MSHNIYNENSKDTLTKTPMYLIFNGNEITPCENITKAIEIAKVENKICTIFRMNNRFGHFWKYYCDISAGVFNDEKI